MGIESSLPKQFNGVVCVKGKAIEEKVAQGYSDYASKKALTSNDRFYICSISKMFTAVAINQLVEQKLLAKEDLVAKYLGDYMGERGITIYHLLTHTSGLPNYVMYRKELDWKEAHTAEDILKVVMSKKRKFTEGTKWSYSNTGYYLLAMIIEKVTGMACETYIEEAIFKPLGMKDSGFSKDNLAVVTPNVKGKEGYVFHPSLLKGAGDVISTAEDMCQFAQAFYQGKLVSDERYKEMIKPVFDNMKVKYGEGLFIQDHFGELCIGHSGSLPTGYSTQLSIYPEKEMVSVVMCNDRKCIHPLVYPDANGKYIDACVAEEVFGKKISVWKKAYM
ncbi:MAG: serine hydrolase domain-containing protein [Cellulosilyticaceae bacterium]